MIGGAYGGYVAQLMEGQMPVDLEEYHSDESTDMSVTACNYRKMRTLPTPPCPRPCMEEGAFRVIADHDEDIDVSSYFSDTDSDDGWEEKEIVK